MKGPKQPETAPVDGAIDPNELPTATPVYQPRTPIAPKKKDVHDGVTSPGF
mgnify:CR=1 FL=1